MCTYGMHPKSVTARKHGSETPAPSWRSIIRLALGGFALEIRKLRNDRRRGPRGAV